MKSSKILVFLFSLLVLTLASCDKELRKRPYGLVNLGKVADLQRPESYLSEHAILLRFDQKGFSAMSLLCTYDLAPLEVKVQVDQQFLASTYSPSTYKLDGNILSGPTEHPLPYYELAIAPGEYGGVADTLFVKVGVEKDKDWRLAIR